MRGWCSGWGAVLGSVIALNLSSCANVGPAADAGVPELWSTAWRLEDLAGSGVVDRVQATLEFPEEGRVSGDASCNRFRGTVTVSDSAIGFAPLATTRKICVEALMHQENRYLAALRAAERFEVDGPFLYIYTAGESQPLRFIGTDETLTSSPDLTGIWTVAGHHIPGISALSDAEATTRHGWTIRLTADQAVSAGNHCDEPVYATESVATDRFLGREFNLPPGGLAPLASLENVAVLEVSCGGARWTAMGARLIGIDANRVLAPWDGVFFELARDHDFRAVGQEPFWHLEIQKGKQIRFTYDLGERQAVTPVPVPGTDPKNGASVYHAVTEANDLRVAIEPTPCTDVMSGRPFEKSVIVTLDGETYHGCGEPLE